MSVIHLNSQNFESTVSGSDKPVIVDFFADWCAPCKMFAPIFEKTSEKLSDTAVFAKLNVDECNEIALKYSVMSIPTVILFKGGQEVARHTGALSSGEILQFLSE